MEFNIEIIVSNMESMNSTYLKVVNLTTDQLTWDILPQRFKDEYIDYHMGEAALETKVRIHNSILGHS